MDSELNRVDHAYYQIKELVIQYELAPESKLIILPGEHLRIDELADYVKASATPVRQALERLQGEGLVDIIPNRGFFSKVPDAAELQDLYEFARLVLEYNLTRPMDATTVARLGRGLARVAAVPAADWTTACVKHHATTIEGIFEQIAQISRNEQMLRMIRNFSDRSRYVRCLRIAQNSDPSAELRECLAIVDRIRNGDVMGACASLETHMRRTIVSLPELIREARSRWAIAAAG